MRKDVRIQHFRNGLCTIENMEGDGRCVILREPLHNPGGLCGLKPGEEAYVLSVGPLFDYAALKSKDSHALDDEIQVIPLECGGAFVLRRDSRKKIT